MFAIKRPDPPPPSPLFSLFAHCICFILKWVKKCSMLSVLFYSPCSCFLWCSRMTQLFMGFSFFLFTVTCSCMSSSFSQRTDVKLYFERCEIFVPCYFLWYLVRKRGLWIRCSKIERLIVNLSLYYEWFSEDTELLNFFKNINRYGTLPYFRWSGLSAVSKKQKIFLLE